MEELIQDIDKVRQSRASAIIAKRMDDFKKIKNEPGKRWFAELCFCILTANSKAKTALAIEKELGVDGFCGESKQNLIMCIKRNKHRFHNNKAEYIYKAREHIDIKKKIKAVYDEEGESATREWLVKKIKGLGFKEASHFLRNVGFKNLAIVDRHILNILYEYGLISEKPKSISKNVYLEIEDKLRKISEGLNMSQAELDLYLWYMKTGEVLK